MSDAKFPTKKYYEILRENPIFSRAFNTTPDLITYDMVASSVVSLYIYYDKIENLEITEVASMSAVNLLANIGGTLGLFIGVSVLSFVELIELSIEMTLVLMQTSLVSRLQRRNNKYANKSRTKIDDDMSASSSTATSQVV